MHRSIIAVMTRNGSLFKTTVQKLKSSKKTYFTEWFCDLGTHVINIDHEGLVRESVCKNKGKICAIKNCWCGVDIEIPKAIDKNTFDEFIIKVQDTNAEQLDEYTSGEIVAVGQVKKIKDQFLLIDWSITKRCNYDCSYCPPNIHDNFSNFPSPDILKTRILPFLKNTNMPVNVIISGGEPTLHPNLLDVVKMIAEYKNTKIRILTNGTASVKKMIDLHKYSSFLISLHHEYVNEKLLTKLSNFIESTQYKNKVTFKTFELHDQDIFWQNIKGYSFVKISKSNPLVEKESGEWL